MSGAKHTPGPWFRNIKPARKYPTIWSGRNKHMAYIAVESGMADEELEANIDLMAASPEMHEALRYVETRCVSEAAYKHASIEDRKMRDMVIAALSKAEGNRP